MDPNTHHSAGEDPADSPEKVEGTDLTGETEETRAEMAVRLNVRKMDQDEFVRLQTLRDTKGDPSVDPWPADDYRRSFGEHYSKRYNDLVVRIAGDRNLQASLDDLLSLDALLGKTTRLEPADRPPDIELLSELSAEISTPEKARFWRGEAEKWHATYLKEDTPQPDIVRSIEGLETMIKWIEEAASREGWTEQQTAHIVECFRQVYEVQERIGMELIMSFRAIALSRSGNYEDAARFVTCARAAEDAQMNSLELLTALRVFRDYATHQELTDEKANALIENLFPRIKNRDPEVEILFDGKSFGHKKGDMYAGEFVCHCHAQEVTPGNTQELMRVLYEIPTTDYAAFDQTREDAITLDSVFVIRDFTHRQYRGLHPILEGMVHFYDTGNRAPLERAYEQRQRTPEDYLGLGYLLERSYYDQEVVEKIGNKKSKTTAIEVVRRMERNTRPIDIEAPETQNTNLNTALHDIEGESRDNTLVGSDLEPALRIINRELLQRQGTRGLDPSFVQALIWIERHCSQVFRDLSYERASNAHETSWFKQVLLFQELTASAEPFDQTRFNQLIGELNASGSNMDAANTLRDHTLWRLNRLAKKYKAEDREDRIGPLWTANTDDAFINIRPTQRTAETKIGERRRLQQLEWQPHLEQMDRLISDPDSLRTIQGYDDREKNDEH